MMKNILNTFYHNKKKFLSSFRGYTFFVKMSFSYSRHIVSETGMDHSCIGPYPCKSGQAIFNSAAGYTKDKVVIRVPVGRGFRGTEQPTPPPWLTLVKESEYLAAQGK